jgi:deazaflavin-dependent oxidoreductase (nitroreductase family)
MNQKNALVIEQFRANNGVVTVVPPRGPVLLLHTWGRKTGVERVTPLMYLDDGGRQVIFASMGGWKRNPDWYHNLLADPNVTVEVGTEVYNARAVLVHGEERDRLYDRMASMYSQFTLYKRKTRRLIPVIVLERKPPAS